MFLSLGSQSGSTKEMATPALGLHQHPLNGALMTLHSLFFFKLICFSSTVRSICLKAWIYTWGQWVANMEVNSIVKRIILVGGVIASPLEQIRSRRVTLILRYLASCSCWFIGLMGNCLNGNDLAPAGIAPWPNWVPCWVFQGETAPGLSASLSFHWNAED